MPTRRVDARTADAARHESTAPTPFRRNQILVLLVLALFAAAPALAWEYWGGDRGGTRFSPLAMITPANVGNLVEAWQFRTGDLDSRPPQAMARTKFQATPLFVENSVIFCSPFNEVIALDPGTGAQKWRFDPKISTAQIPANRYNCRGVAYWVDEQAAVGAACRSRIVMGTNDARLIVLDAKTGAPCADFGGNGEIKLDIGKPREWPGEFQITSAPVVSRGVIIVGSAIADNRSVDAPRGTVRAYDARSGRARWSWDPLVHDGIVAGHANVWAPMSVDEERGLVFLPTGSASPDFWGGKRPGNNEHANSVVALRAETGELVWSFQTVHHDVWDYDVPAQPTLARIDTGEGLRDVVIQPTKQGFVFVLDRMTGKPVWPVEERAVPQGGVAGEALSPTQPFPTHVPALVPQTISSDDVFGLIPFKDRAVCRAQLAAARNEGLYTPPSTQGTVLFPMTGGGVNWGGAAFDPVNQILYANTSRAVHIVKLIPRADAEGFKPPPGVDFGAQRGAIRDDARAGDLAIGHIMQQAAVGRDGRGRFEGRQDSLAIAGRNHGRSRAGSGVQLGLAVGQWCADHGGRRGLHWRGRFIPARIQCQIRRRTLAGQAAGARHRQSHDLPMEGRAICRDRRRRSFRDRHLDRRQRGGVSAGARGGSALAVVAHHRPAGRTVLGRSDHGCDYACVAALGRDAVVAPPRQAEGGANVIRVPDAVQRSYAAPQSRDPHFQRRCMGPRLSGAPLRAAPRPGNAAHSIAKALDTIATGLLSEALNSVTRPKLMVRPSRTTRASASTSDEVTARMKCVVWSTVVMGRKPRFAARIAITIAVSASAISAWPQTMPPARHSRSENAIRKIAPGCQSAGAPGWRSKFPARRSESLEVLRTHGTQTRRRGTRLASSRSNAACLMFGHFIPRRREIAGHCNAHFRPLGIRNRASRGLAWLENAAISSLRWPGYRVGRGMCKRLAIVFGVVVLGLLLNGCTKCGPIWDDWLQSPKSLQVGSPLRAGGGCLVSRFARWYGGTNSGSIRMTIFRAAALIALLAGLSGPAYAQMSGGGGGGSTPNINLMPEFASKTPEEKEADAIKEKAYRESLRKIPDAKASNDPWGTVRSTGSRPRRLPAKPKTKTGSTAN